MAEQDPSYLSTYGITSPWGAWLLRRHADQLVDDARSFSQRTLVPPICWRCPYRMVWRPGAFKCYRHDPPAEISITHEYERAPELNVLDKLDRTLDYRWNPGALGAHGYWEVVEE